MRIIGNILWHFPFLGFLSALCNFIFGSLLVLTVVAAPIGFGLIQFSKFQLAPFSYSMISKNDLSIQQNSLWQTYSFIVKIIYIPLGLFLLICGIMQVIGLFVTIVGIPMAIVIAKSLTTYLQPVGKICVPVGVAMEVEARKYADQADKYFN